MKSLLKIAPILDVSVEILQTLPEEHGGVIIENNTFESGSIANINENDNIIHDNIHPVDQVLDFFKDYMKEEREQKKELMDRIQKLEELIEKIAK